MKLFLKKCMLFAALNLCVLVLLFAVFMLIGDQYLGNYQAAILDKIERLQAIQEPKIVLAGNSNVCFGFQSSLIEEAFHMPVVDLGLNGSLGNAYQENMVKLGVHAGDIVIVCHSSYSDNNTFDNADLTWITLEHHAKLWSIVGIQDLFPLLKAFPNYVVQATKQYFTGQEGNIAPNHTSYSRKAFNEYGDVCLRFDGSYIFDETSVQIPKINKTCTERLNRLNEYLNDRGATLLIAGYPIGDGEYTPEKEQFDVFEQELRDSLNCCVISHFTDYFIPYHFFYDTRLHLSEEGARIRTQLLIHDLSQWMIQSGHTKSS